MTLRCSIAGELDQGCSMDKKIQFNFGYFVLALLFVTALQVWFGSQKIAHIDYSEFQKLLNDREISEVTVTETRITGKFVHPRDGVELFTTARVDPLIADEFIKDGVKVSGGSDETWMTILLSWIAPLLFFGAIWFFMSKYMGCGTSSTK